MKKFVAMIIALFMMFTLVNAACAEAAADRDWLDGNTITIVVPFKAGGSLDLMVRAFVPFWEETAGATFVVDNREGANSMLGTAYFFTQKQDMQTIYCGTQTYLSGNIVQGANFGIEDFALFNMQQVDPTTLTVLKDSPYQTMEALIAAIQANPGKIKCGMTAGGAGAIMLKMLADTYGLDFKMITYDSGNEFRTALLGGHVDFIAGSANGDLGLGDQGKPLVVCGATRNVLWPDTPTTDELWPNLGIPESLGSCRFFSCSTKAAEKYPERFAALLETYNEAFANEEYQALLEGNGQKAVSNNYGPAVSNELNLGLHQLIVENVDALISE